MQHVHRITRLSALALGISGALAFGQVHASGFQIKENSVKGMGAAYAGAPVNTGDTSVVVNNPALMATFEGTTVQVDASVIDLSFQFEGGGYDVTGQPLTGGDGGEAGDVTPIPAFSVVHKLDNGLALGAMVSVPFGLKTEYDDDFVGRYYAHTSEVEIIDLTVSAAFDLIPDRLSIGAGLVYSTADVTLSKAVDFGTVLFGAGVPLPFARPQAADGFAEIQGDDTGLGWVVGVHMRPTDQLAIGLSHHSEIDYDLTGTADFTVPAPARATFDAVGAAALFQDGGASAKLTTPSTTALAVSYAFTDRFTMMANYTKTDWHSLQEVRIEFENPDRDSVEEFDWKDTAFYALGGEFQLSPAWTLRAGYAYDETPTTFATRTPRLPDEDRKWYTVGATWQFSDQLEFNFAYALIDPDTPQIGLITPPQEGGQRLFGEYQSSVSIYGVSAQFHF